MSEIPANEALSLDLLPSEIIFEVLRKLRCDMIIKMMKTCSRMKTIGDDYKEFIFSQPTTGIMLVICARENDNTFDTSLSLDQFINPLFVLQTLSQEKLDLLRGLAIYKLHVRTILETTKNVEKLRQFLKNLPVKFVELEIDYGKEYFPISDVVPWKRATIIKMHTPFGQHLIHQQSVFCGRLKEEKRSEEFDVEFKSWIDCVAIETSYFRSYRYRLLPTNPLLHPDRPRIRNGLILRFDDPEP